MTSSNSLLGRWLQVDAVGAVIGVVHDEAGEGTPALATVNHAAIFDTCCSIAHS